MTANDVFWKLGGACVFPKTLVRIDTLSTDCRARFQNIFQQEAEDNPHYDLVANETVLHGWIVAPPDKNGNWCVFVFCVLRNVLLPPEFLSVHSVLCGALALGDLLVAFRQWEHRSLFEIPGHDLSLIHI